MIEEIEELIKKKKYKKLKEELAKINNFDLAELIEDLKRDEAIKVFSIMEKDKAAEVFTNLPIEIEAELISVLTDKEAVALLNEMYADDAADLVEEMPANVVKRLLKKCPKETRNDINRLLNYPENSAGSLMTVEFAELKENLSIEGALEKLRKEKEEYETLNTCFVVNASRKLLGHITLEEIVFSKPEKTIKEIYDENIISVKTTEDQEEVANMFKKYDLTVMPVVDSEERLVGIITIDDVVDVLEEETTEDMEIMAAITPSSKSYLKTGIFEIWKNRIPWLLLMMLSATFTGKIIEHYEGALAGYIILTSFIPMLMGTGGNAGSQSSVTVIRGISLGEIEFGDILKVIWKEFGVSIICGLTLAIINFLRLILIDKLEVLVSAVVCITLFVTVLVSKLIGCILPLVAKKIGFDPAVMASPFITTIVDAVSLLTYFQIASMLLGI